MLRRTLALALLLSAVAVGAHAQTLDDILKRGKVMIGIDASNTPYGMMGKTMEPEGLDVDVANAIAKRMGVKLEQCNSQVGALATQVGVLGDKIETLLTPLLALDSATLRARRRDKFLEMGRSA